MHLQQTKSPAANVLPLTAIAIKDDKDKQGGSLLSYMPDQCCERYNGSVAPQKINNQKVKAVKRMVEVWRQPPEEDSDTATAMATATATAMGMKKVMGTLTAMAMAMVTVTATVMVTATATVTTTATAMATATVMETLRAMAVAAVVAKDSAKGWGNGIVDMTTTAMTALRAAVLATMAAGQCWHQLKRQGQRRWHLMW
jgi:hypothetical protein